MILNVALFRGMRVAIAADPRYLRFSVIEDGATMHYNLRVRACSLSLPLFLSLSVSSVCGPRSAFLRSAFCGFSSLRRWRLGVVVQCGVVLGFLGFGLCFGLRPGGLRLRLPSIFDPHARFGGVPSSS